MVRHPRQLYQFDDWQYVALGNRHPPENGVYDDRAGSRRQRIRYAPDSLHAALCPAGCSHSRTMGQDSRVESKCASLEIVCPSVQFDFAIADFAECDYAEFISQGAVSGYVTVNWISEVRYEINEYFCRIFDSKGQRDYEWHTGFSWHTCSCANTL